MLRRRKVPETIMPVLSDLEGHRATFLRNGWQCQCGYIYWVDPLILDHISIMDDVMGHRYRAWQIMTVESG